MKQFLSSNQIKFKEHALNSVRQKCMKGLEAPDGTGHEFAIRNLIKYSPYLKVVYVDCLRTQSVRNIYVSLMKEALNVRFSNLNYFRVSLDELLSVLIDRCKSGNDLNRGKDLLIVIDHIHVLSSSSLSICIDYF